MTFLIRAAFQAVVLAAFVLGAIVAHAGNWVLRSSGWNYYGQLGNGGNAYSRAYPLTVAEDVVQISASGAHSLFVKGDGTLWGMGRGAQLGAMASSTQLTPIQIASGVVHAAAGDTHTLFITEDGSLWGMGSNRYGQIGLGSAVAYTSAPQKIADDVAAVVGGYEHSLFLKKDGSLWGMGWNFYGQVGDGSATNQFVPVQVAVDVSQVAAGHAHTLILKKDATLWAVGDNGRGQLGSTTLSLSRTPIFVAAGVSRIAAGGSNTLFLKTDSTLWGLGKHGFGMPDNDQSHPTAFFVADDVIDMQTGDEHSLFIKRDNSLWCMGNVYGQFGDGHITGGAPVQVAVGVRRIAAGARHSLYLASTYEVRFELGDLGTRDGGGALVQQVLAGEAAVAPEVSAAIGWALAGWNGDFSVVTSELTITALYEPLTPPSISTPPASTVVARGDSAVFEVVAGGRLLAFQWFEGTSGDTTRPVPGASSSFFVTRPLFANAEFWVRVQNPLGVVDGPTVTVGVAPFAPRILSATGLNSSGQLGDGTTTNRSAPVVVADNVAGIAAGGQHSVYFTVGGTLFAMGNNSTGQLGDGSTTNRPVPVSIAGGVVQVAAGGYHTLFLKEDGVLFAMGSNSSGQLGDGTKLQRATPVQIASDVAQVAAGYNHSFFVKRDGTLWATGANGANQLGDGTTLSRSQPVLVASGVARVACGHDHSLFLKTDGTLWSVGQNSQGQLGDGTTTNRDTPVRIAVNVTDMVGGGQHTLFIKRDRSLWATGANGYGQLGDGTNQPRKLPAKIADDVQRAAADSLHSLFLKADGSLWLMGYDNGQFSSTYSHRTPVPVASEARGMDAGHAFTLLLSPAYYTITFDPGAHGSRVGGGALVQSVEAGRAAVAPRLLPEAGWVFVGWDRDFTAVTSSFTTQAAYEARAPRNFSEWAAGFDLDEAASTPDADPDGDGLPNLLEYAFGASPMSPTPVARRPVLSALVLDGIEVLVLSHRRHKFRPVQFIYEMSSDLVRWTPLDVSPTISNPDVDGDGMVEEVSVDVSLEGRPKVFLRIQVRE